MEMHYTTFDLQVNRHKRNAHAEKKYACSECPLKFRTEPQLTAHVKIKHTRVSKRAIALGRCRIHLSLSPVKRRDMGLSLSVRPSVRLSVRLSVRPSP